MVALHELPFETLVDILSSLDTANLAQISLVCRRLSVIAEPLLYQSPSLSILQGDDRQPSLERFIETLIHSPRTELATHVRSLHVEWNRSCRLQATSYPVPGWSPAFTHPAGFHGVHCVLLLHLLPSVRVLRITPPRDLPGSSHGYISHCLEAPTGDPGTPTLHLQSLRKFICPYAITRGGIPYATSRGGITFAAVKALMKLPCIDSIDTHMTNIPALPPAGTPRDEGFSTLTCLRVSVPTITPFALGILLRAPVALRRLSYVAVDYGVFAMADLAACLAAVRGSLEFLHLDLIRTYVAVSAREGGVPEGSFAEWPALHTLRCSMRELLGYPGDGNAGVELAQVLPRGLRRLEVAMDQYWLYASAVDRLVVLLRAKREVVPLLECVAMGLWGAGDGPDRERLRAACEEAGVELVQSKAFGW